MSAGVLVGYDGSDCAKAALATGVEVAKAYGDKLIVAFGYEVNPVGGEVADYAKALHDLAAQDQTLPGFDDVAGLDPQHGGFSADLAA